MYGIELLMGFAVFCSAHPDVSVRLEIPQTPVLAGGFLEVDLVMTNATSSPISIGAHASSGILLEFQTLSSNLNSENMVHESPLDARHRYIAADLAPMQEAVFTLLVNHWTRIPHIPGRYALQLECELVSPTVINVDSPDRTVHRWHVIAMSPEIIVQAAQSEAYQQAYKPVWEALAPIMGEVEHRVEALPPDAFCKYRREIGKILYASSPEIVGDKRKLLQSGQLDYEMTFDLFYMLTIDPSIAGANLVKDLLSGRLADVADEAKSFAESCAQALIRSGRSDIQALLAPHGTEDVEPLALDSRLLTGYTGAARNCTQLVVRQLRER